MQCCSDIRSHGHNQRSRPNAVAADGDEGLDVRVILQDLMGSFDNRGCVHLLSSRLDVVDSNPMGDDGTSREVSTNGLPVVSDVVVDDSDRLLDPEHMESVSMGSRGGEFAHGVDGVAYEGEGLRTYEMPNHSPHQFLF